MRNKSSFWRKKKHWNLNSKHSDYRGNPSIIQRTITWEEKEISSREYVKTLKIKLTKMWIEDKENIISNN